jgi:hypothetical protein
MNRDRKDISHADSPATPAVESTHERESRKAHESHQLDEALKETFPTSDPVSPFVPAVRSSAQPAPDASRHCGHPGCTCAVGVDETWCSDACRDQQQGYLHANATCACGHAGCARSGSSAGD